MRTAVLSTSEKLSALDQHVREHLSNTLDERLGELQTQFHGADQALQSRFQVSLSDLATDWAQKIAPLSASQQQTLKKITTVAETFSQQFEKLRSCTNAATISANNKIVQHSLWCVDKFTETEEKQRDAHKILLDTWEKVSERTNKELNQLKMILEAEIVAEGEERREGLREVEGRCGTMRDALLERVHELVRECGKREAEAREGEVRRVVSMVREGAMEEAETRKMAEENLRSEVTEALSGVEKRGGEKMESVENRLFGTGGGLERLGAETREWVVERIEARLAESRREVGEETKMGLAKLENSYGARGIVTCANAELLRGRLRVATRNSCGCPIGELLTSYGVR